MQLKSDRRKCKTGRVILEEERGIPRIEPARKGRLFYACIMACKTPGAYCRLASADFSRPCNNPLVSILFQ